MAARRRGPRSAADRVRGLLVILPWLMRRGSATFDEIAREFNMERQHVIDDLMMASMCGTPPYTPYDLTDLIVYDDEVVVGAMKRFDERLRLTPTEALALAVLADAARDLPGMRFDRRLRSAVRKLRDIIGNEVVDVEVPRPEFLDIIGEAAAKGQKLRITYWSPATSETTQRTIVPRSVFSDRGHWYVHADDELRNAERHFRIDRIREVELLDDFVDVGTRGVDIPDWFADASDLPVARLRVRPTAKWIVETYPCAVLSEDIDGSMEIDIRFSSEHWLSRILMRGGTDVEVVGPEPLRDLAARTAALVLSRYSENSVGN